MRSKNSALVCIGIAIQLMRFVYSLRKNRGADDSSASYSQLHNFELVYKVNVKYLQSKKKLFLESISNVAGWVGYISLSF
jgi:hypothetical protein